MIETYNINNSGLNPMMNNFMEKCFFFIIIAITVWIFSSLIIWLIGAKIKSEKVIKLGLKNFMLSVAIQIFVLAIPLFVVLIR